MKTKNISLLICLIVTVFISACGNKDEKEIKKEILLSLPEQYTLTVEDQIKLEVTVSPEDQKEHLSFVWSSSDNKVAEISPDGLVSAKSEGEALITLQAEGAKNEAHCKIIVQAKPNPVITIKDEAFKDILLLDYDKNNDGELQASELEQITELQIGGKQIESLEGIEHIKNLKILLCQGNRIKKLDLSKNLKLEIVSCNSNPITYLSVKNLKVLRGLYARNCRIDEIDVTDNIALEDLFLNLNSGGIGGSTGLKKIDVSNCKKLKRLSLSNTNISELDVKECPDLTYLNIVETGFGNMNRFSGIQHIDLRNNTKLDTLLANGLGRPGKSLLSLDLTQNKKLRMLTLGGNSLKELDVTQCPLLEHLDASRNQLEELDVSKCTKLVLFACNNNKIKELNLSHASRLEYLYAQMNQLKTIDLSNTAVSHVELSDNQLTHVEFGDRVFNTIQKSEGKPYFYLKLTNNKLSSIDLARQKHLAYLEIAYNQLEQLDLSGCDRLGGLVASHNNLSRIQLPKNENSFYHLDLDNNKFSGTLDTSILERIGFGDFRGNKSLKKIILPYGTNPESTSYVVDHKTGKNGIQKDFKKDDTAEFEVAQK